MAIIVLGIYAIGLLSPARNLCSIIDDAFITYQAARNVSRGYGFVFYQGGPTVEASSSFLQVVTLAALGRLGAGIPWAALTSNVAATALLLLSLLLVGQRHLGRIGLIPPLALALMTITWSNTVMGLETPLYALLLFTSAWLCIRSELPTRRPLLWLAAAGFGLALCSLTRPEAPLFFVVLTLFRLARLAARVARGQTVLLKPELAWLGGFLCLYLPYLLWRSATFETFIPNTYYAKERQYCGLANKLVRGARYLGEIALIHPSLPLGIILGALHLRREPNVVTRTLLFFVLTQCLFMVLSGGDWSHMYGMARFVFPIYPALLFLIVHAVVLLLRTRLRLAIAISSLIMGGLALVGSTDISLRWKLPSRFTHMQEAHHQGLRTFSGYFEQDLKNTLQQVLENIRQRKNETCFQAMLDAAAGQWIRRTYGPTARVASCQAGQLAYYSDLPFFDLAGLGSPSSHWCDKTCEIDTAVRLEQLHRFRPSLLAIYRHADRHPDEICGADLLAHLEGSFGFRWFLFHHHAQFSTFLLFERGHRSPLANEGIVSRTQAELRGSSTSYQSVDLSPIVR